VRAIERGPGETVGEASFLTGCVASETVTARTGGSALVVNDRILRRIEAEQPILAAGFCRLLADKLEHWQGHEAALREGVRRSGPGTDIEVYMCRNDAMLTEAYRLRYQVYCVELGRSSPNADYEKKIIRDWLDDFGLTFIAVQDNQVVGTIRGNLSTEGSLGILEDWYGMDASIYHPQNTAVLTKFAVKKSCRSSAVAMRLISAVRQYSKQLDVKECYIDCIPRLLPFFRLFGFRVAGRKFTHYENGPSYPMIISLAQKEEETCAMPVPAHSVES
jgi:predicted GNAT family N-acyltransferase